MNRRRLVLVVTIGVLLLTVAGYEARVAQRQRTEIAALLARSRQLRAELARLTARQATAADDLAKAQAQLAALPVPSRDEAGGMAQRRTEMNQWLGRVKRLHALFAERPDQRIPEMALLKTEDWLRVAKSARLETSEGMREAMAAIRTDAVEHFSQQLSVALRKFVRTSPPDGPLNISALAPYLPPPVDPEMLARYQLSKGSGASSSPDTVEWIVQNTSAPDPDYDTRYQVLASERSSGMNTSSGPVAWIPNFREKYTGAAKAYVEVNHGARPTGIADILPFFNPPLDPAIAAKLIKAERERTP